MIDLRDESELEDAPNVFAGSATVNYVSLPLIGDRLSKQPDWKTVMESYPTLHEMYVHFLDNCQPQIGSIVTAIAEKPTATIFHCYAGKDRTGIIAALVLNTLGVSDAVIVEDYAQSHSRITQLFPDWHREAVENGRDMALLERDKSSHPETMLNTLDYLRQRYGGIAQYLYQCGVSDRQFEQLREQFVR